MCASNKLTIAAASTHNIKTIKIPPDGNWGWAITISFAIFNLIYLASLSNFILIYNGKINRIDLSSVDISIITNIHCALSMCMAILAGPLVNQFGYRFVALASGVAILSGMILSSFSHNFVSFLITYGIVTGVGFGFGHAAFILALNSYFTIRRNQANCLALVIASIGPIAYPLFLTHILKIYGVIGCILILGAISAHIIMAAMLLQPVEWHLEDSFEIIRMETRDQNDPVQQDSDDHTVFDFSRDFLQKRPSMSDIGLSSRYNRLTNESNHHTYYNAKLTSTRQNIGQSVSLSEVEAFISMMFHSGSIQRIYFRERNEDPSKCIKLNTLGNNNNWNKEPNENDDQELSRVTKPKASFFKNSVFWTINIIDLNLLKNKLFLGLIFGMACSVFGELNFTILTPFILSDLNYSMREIIIFISFVPTADLLFRVFLHYFGGYLRIGSKLMFLLSLILAVISRLGVYLATSFHQLVIVAVFVALGKGIRLMYIQSINPTIVHKHKAASMAGIQILTNGICMLILGPIIGWIRDATGDYTYCLIFLIAMPFIHFLILAFELICTQWKNIETEIINEDD